MHLSPVFSLNLPFLCCCLLCCLMRRECIFYLFFVLPHEHLVHVLPVLVLLLRIVLCLAPGALPPGAVFRLSSVASLRSLLFVVMVFLTKSFRAPPLLHKNILCVLSRSTWLGECEPTDSCQAEDGHPSDCKSVAAFSSLKATLRSVTSAVGILFFGLILILFFSSTLVSSVHLLLDGEHLHIFL